MATQVPMCECTHGWTWCFHAIKTLLSSGWANNILICTTLPVCLIFTAALQNTTLLQNTRIGCSNSKKIQKIVLTSNYGALFRALLCSIVSCSFMPRDQRFSLRFRNLSCRLRLSCKWLRLMTSSRRPQVFGCPSFHLHLSLNEAFFIIHNTLHAPESPVTHSLVNMDDFLFFEAKV